MQILHNAPLLSLLLLVVLASVSNAFLLPTPSSSSSYMTMKAEANNDNKNGMERRTLLQSMGKTLGLSALVLGGLNVVATTRPAQAAVGEGMYVYVHMCICAYVCCTQKRNCLYTYVHTYIHTCT